MKSGERRCRRSAAELVNGRPGRKDMQNGRTLIPILSVSRRENARRGQCMMALRRGSLLAARLPDAALADRRFLDRRAQGMEIVCGRYNREQHNQRASQSQQALPRRKVSSRVRRLALSPQPIGGQGQQQPREVQQQFHISVVRGGRPRVYSRNASFSETPNPSQCDLRDFGQRSLQDAVP